MMNYKAIARIHSLGGQKAEITVLEKVKDKDNDYIVDYNGVKCHAIFNHFQSCYYVDDVYRKVSL